MSEKQTQTGVIEVPSERRGGWFARLAAAAALAAVMVAGVLVLGRLAPSDVVAMVLTTGFFAVVGGVVLWVVRANRTLLLPLGGTFAVVAGVAGVVLGLPLVTDDVVDEQVIRVESGDAAAGEATPAGDASEAESGDGGGTSSDAAPDGEASPRAVAAGDFEARSHPGRGTATVIEVEDGSQVLTLTDFETDNGPDLLVYLVPATAAGDSVDGFVDLGALRGNIGDQQYVIPEGVDAGPGWRVVIWCRAFAVNFTEAVLT